MSIHKSPARMRHVLAAFVVLAALAAASEPAEAQAGVTTYYACYVPGSGTIYRIKAAGTPDACKKSTHVEFQWADFGRASDPIIAQTSITIAPGSVRSVAAPCPVGTILYTGGYSVSSDALVRVIVSRPEVGNPDITSGNWFVRAWNESATPQEVTAHARCLRL